MIDRFLLNSKYVLHTSLPFQTRNQLIHAKMLPTKLSCTNAPSEICSEEQQTQKDKHVDVDHVYYNNGETLLGIACANGQAEKARMLINRGADVNKRNQKGERPVHKACHNGHLDIVR
jgi:hypothetical protein